MIALTVCSGHSWLIVCPQPQQMGRPFGTYDRVFTPDCIAGFAHQAKAQGKARQRLDEMRW